jgi:hypothetical protein
MTDSKAILRGTAAPQDRPVAEIDASDLPPPEPLRQTLERLVELDDDVVLIQYNDRVPQHLFPRLEERGYRYETLEDERVLTVIWRD